jgi:hypothetical protein
MKKNVKWAIKDPKTGSVINMDYTNEEEKIYRSEFIKSYLKNPIPDHSILSNLGLFVNSKTFSRLIFLNEFYKIGMKVMGQVFDFGTRWGQNISIFMACRGMYEPFNRHRKIIGFDTFGGFPKTISSKDGNSEMINVGNISVTKNYFEYIKNHLTILEKNNSLPHITKFELVRGDASKTIKEYFKKNPHALVSHAFFDFDLYKPTKDCLKEILKRTPKGAIIGFDEINDEDSPGETQALMESLDIRNISLKKFPWVSRVSYFVKE